MTSSLEDLARNKYFSEAIDAYARGSKDMETHAVSQCLPAVAALELDESYASIVLTARMDNLLGRIIEYGAGRQGDAQELLFSTDSAASSFSSKTKLAFFLGFLTPLMKSAIDDCRGIRNVYAHSDSPEAGRSNKKYISRKQALVSRDSELTKRAIEHIRSLAKHPINRTDDEVAVTAIMVQICDNLDWVAAINKLYGPSNLPKVISAFYGFADAPSDI
jgi:hypothetical protein